MSDMDLQTNAFASKINSENYYKNVISHWYIISYIDIQYNH